MPHPSPPVSRDHATPSPTCFQGSCCDIRCFNAPHNWQLGWGSPIATINSKTMPTGGTWVTFTLPSQQASDVNMIMIQPDWTAVYAFTNTYAWYLSYR